MLVLERRAERSTAAALASPLIAIVLTLATMAVLFALLGKNPLTVLVVYFVEPLTDAYSLQEIVVKATPLVLIAVGLSLCYIANVWNIGAEGQFLIGAVCGSWLAVKTHGTDAGPWVLPAMLALGALGGAEQATGEADIDFARFRHRLAAAFEAMVGELVGWTVDRHT